MKKILTILGTLTIIGSTATSVVSCKVVNYESPPFKDPEDNMLKFFINISQPETRDLTNQQILDNLTLQLNHFLEKKVYYDVDFTIGSIHRDIRTNLVKAQKVYIYPNKDSNNFKQEGILYLQRNFSYMEEWFNAVNGTPLADEISGRELESKVINEFRRWAPTAYEGTDYYIDRKTGYYEGSWTLRYDSFTRIIYGDVLTFNLTKR